MHEKRSQSHRYRHAKEIYPDKWNLFSYTSLIKDELAVSIIATIRNINDMCLLLGEKIRQKTLGDESVVSDDSSSSLIVTTGA